MGTKWYLTVAVGVVCAACSGDPGGPVEEETSSSRARDDVAIREHLARHGVDLDLVVLEEDAVRIDGDVLVPRHSILADIGAAELSSDGFVPKAYWYTGLLSNGDPAWVPPVSSARYSIHPNVPAGWRDAIRYAAGEWNKTTCIRLTEGAGFTVFLMGEAGTAADGTPAGAVASFPVIDRSGQSIGRSVTIDTGIAGSTNTSFMRSLMLHEIGHLLGFMHPRRGTHIPNTSASSTGCGAGGCVASYPTVMDYTNTEQTLTADDLKAANLIYKKRIFRGTLTCP